MTTGCTKMKFQPNLSVPCENDRKWLLMSSPWKRNAAVRETAVYIPCGSRRSSAYLSNMNRNAKPLRARVSEVQAPKNSSWKVGTKVDWRPAFLAALAETGMYQKAAKAAGISIVTQWRERRINPAFEKDCNEALQVAGTKLMDEAFRRAIEGIPRLLFNSKTGEPFIDPRTGKPYIEYTHSDKVLIYLLERIFPKELGEKKKVQQPEDVVYLSRADRLKALEEVRAAIHK